MKKIKSILRKWARKFYEKQIRVYGIQQFYTMDMLMAMDGKKTRRHIERDMVLRIADKMYEENMIEFEMENDIRTGGVITRAKIRLI